MTVDMDQPMGDHLSGLIPGASESSLVDDVVQPSFQHLEEVVAGNSVILLAFWKKR